MEKAQQIKLVSPHKSLEHLLWTLGIPFDMSQPKEGDTQRLWVTQNPAELQWVRTHHPQAFILNLLNSQATKTRYYNWAPKHSGVPFHTGLEGIDWKGPRSQYLGNSTWKALDSSLAYDDQTLHWGLPLEALFEANGSLSKSFSHVSSPRLPHEEVSSLSKGGIIILLRESLRYLLKKSGQTLLARPSTPEGYVGIFLFKVDTDGANHSHLMNYLESLQKHQLKGSLFLDMGAISPTLTVDVPAPSVTQQEQLPSHEWNLHCDEHFTSDNQSLNRSNLDQGLQKLQSYLQKLFIPSSKILGHGAPYGSHPPHLGELQKDLNFEFGSEFAWAYDSWPLNILKDHHLNHHWQIPFHPICPQSLRSARATTAQVIQYFKHLGAQQLSQGLPCAWYDHPSHNSLEEFHQYLNFIHRWIKGDNPLQGPLKIMTTYEYLKWWRFERNQLALVEVPKLAHKCDEQKFLKARRFNFRRWKQDKLRKYLYRRTQ